MNVYRMNIQTILTYVIQQVGDSTADVEDKHEVKETNQECITHHINNALRYQTNRDRNRR